MKPGEILYDEQQHQKWLHEMRKRYKPAPILIPWLAREASRSKEFSPAHCRGVDAAESFARKKDDIESAATERDPGFNRRLRVGFALLAGCNRLD